MYQKASPKGEPRTWFSHPKNSKNEVLPAWELSFRVLLFFVVFCVFGRPFENSSFTCMGAQFWRTRSAILCFLSFLKTQKNTSGGFSGPLGSKTPPHGPKTPPNHDFGTILEVFWTDFGRIFGIILEVFFMKNVVLPAWELIFQKFRCQDSKAILKLESLYKHN